MNTFTAVIIYLLKLLTFTTTVITAVSAATPIDYTTYQNLRYAMEIMKISYCIGNEPYNVMKPTITSFTCRDCSILNNFKLVRAWATTAKGNFNTAGYIAVNNAAKGIYLVFRGTKSLSDVITDITVGYVAWNDPKITSQCNQCQLHMGFYRSFTDTWAEMSPQLLSTINQYPDYKIHIYGHSLGGATASLFALQLRLMNISNERLLLITAGQPRVFNSNFASWFDSQFQNRGLWGAGRNTYRITHKNDIVTLVPNFLDYQPVSGEIYIDYDDTNPPVNNVYQCSGHTDAACSSKQLPYLFRLLDDFPQGHLKYFIPMNGCK